MKYLAEDFEKLIQVAAQSLARVPLSCTAAKELARYSLTNIV